MSIFTKISSLQDQGNQKILNLCSEYNFQHYSNFLILVKFHILKDRGGQKSGIWAQFSMQLKFFTIFAKIHILQDQVGQKS